MATTTGFEGYTLSELERKAYADQNFLAQEILDRCRQDPAEKMFKEERQSKVRTQWVRREPT